MQSLDNGNLHQVIFVRGDCENKMYNESNPQFKTLNLYDARHRRFTRSLAEQSNSKPVTEMRSEPEEIQEKKKKVEEDAEEQAQGQRRESSSAKQTRSLSRVDLLASPSGEGVSGLQFLARRTLS